MVRFIILTLFIFTTFSTLAADTRESMTFDIESLQFKRPAKNVGVGGTFQFNSFFLVYDNLVTDISNEDGRFNAQIFVRQNFIGLVASQIKLGVYGEAGDILTTIQEATGSKLQFSLNSKKLSLKAGGFSMTLPTFKLAVYESSSLFCQKRADHQSNNPQDLEVACLNYLNFQPSEGESVNAEIESIPTTEEESYVKFQGKVKQLELTDQSIRFSSDKMLLNLDNAYLVRSAGLSVNCLKKNLDSINTDELLQFCLNGFHLSSGHEMFVENMNDQSSFAFRPNLLKIENEMFVLETSLLTMREGASVTKLQNLNISCFIDNEKDGADVGTYMEGCLKKGRVELGSLESSDRKENKIFAENLKSNNKSKGTLRDLELNVSSGELNLNAKVKFLLNFKLKVEGQGSYNPSAKELKIHVSKARLPLGISSVKLLMYFVKKLVPSDTVVVSGKDIIVKL